jgi:hypothetical protein
VSFGVPNGEPASDALAPCKRCGTSPVYRPHVGKDGMYECPHAGAHQLEDLEAAEAAKRKRAAAQWNNENRKGM